MSQDKLIDHNLVRQTKLEKLILAGITRNNVLLPNKVRHLEHFLGRPRLQGSCWAATLHKINFHH